MYCESNPQGLEHHVNIDGNENASLEHNRMYREQTPWLRTTMHRSVNPWSECSSPTPLSWLTPMANIWANTKTDRASQINVSSAPQGVVTHLPFCDCSERNSNPRPPSLNPSPASSKPELTSLSPGLDISNPARLSTKDQGVGGWGGGVVGDRGLGCPTQC